MTTSNDEKPVEVFKRDPKTLIIPRSIPQQTVDVLLRIEQLLITLVDRDDETPYDGPPLGDLVKGALESGAIKPTKTPFMEQAGKKRKGK